MINQTLKKEKERTRLIMGGDKLDYDGLVSIKIADITTQKVVFNNVISILNEKLCSIRRT